MKPSIKTIVFAALFTIGANGILTAQTSSAWAGQYYRAKFGRPSTTEEARIKTAETTAAVTNSVTVYRPAADENAWMEQWFLDKYGRHTPKVEARLREIALTNSSAASGQTSVPVDTRFDNWYRAKYGRPSPIGKGGTK